MRPPYPEELETRETSSGAVAPAAALPSHALAYYPQARFIAGDARDQSVGPMSVAKLDALNAAGLLIPIELSITRNDIRAAGERAKSSDDFLPRTVQQKPMHPAATPVLAAGYPVTLWKNQGLNGYLTTVRAPAPVIVALQQFWFPGWEARIDGRTVKTTPSGPQAVVSCEVPPGNHTVEFDYRGLPQRRTGFLISACALAFASVSVWLLGRMPGPQEGGLA